jgi:hypothetical protein
MLSASGEHHVFLGLVDGSKPGARGYRGLIAKASVGSLVFFDDHSPTFETEDEAKQYLRQATGTFIQAGFSSAVCPVQQVPGWWVGTRFYADITDYEPKVVKRPNAAWDF